MHTSKSKIGLWWTCKNCGERNIGPALVEQMAKPPDREKHRREKRRETAAKSPPTAPAVAKVTRTKKPATNGTAPKVETPSPKEAGKPPVAAPSPPAPSPARKPEPVWRRLMGYGEEDE